MREISGSIEGSSLTIKPSRLAASMAAKLDSSSWGRADNRVQREAKAPRRLVHPTHFILRRGIVGVPQDRDPIELRHGRLEQLEPLRTVLARQQRQAGDVAARMGEAGRETDADRIAGDADDRNRRRRFMRSE